MYGFIQNVVRYMTVARILINMSEGELGESCVDNKADVDKSLERTKKPKLSFGINQILGEQRCSRSSSREASTSDKCDSDNEREASDTGRSRSTSPVTSPTLSSLKYDEAFAHAHGVFPLDLATGSLLPLAGCGLYRSSHGVVKVPAQRPHPMFQMFNPYSIPWIDFRRDRFGGGHASSMSYILHMSLSCHMSYVWCITVIYLHCYYTHHTEQLPVYYVCIPVRAATLETDR